MSEKLNEKLKDLGMMEEEEKIKFDDFQNKIREFKKKEDIFHLAENIRRLHRAIHVELIGNRNKEDKLNYLYHEIMRELENILNNFDKERPFFIRYQKAIIVISLLLFFIIEIVFK